MGGAVAITAGVGDDQGDKAVTQGVKRRGAHATRRGQSGDDAGVHAPRAQIVGQIRSEEGAGILFGDDRVVRSRTKRLGEIAQTIARVERGQGGDLAIEEATVARRIARRVHHPGEHHRRAAAGRGVPHHDRDLAFGLDVGEQGRCRLEIGAGEIDEDQGGPRAGA